MKSIITVSSFTGFLNSYRNYGSKDHAIFREGEYKDPLRKILFIKSEIKTVRGVQRLQQ